MSNLALEAKIMNNPKFMKAFNDFPIAMQNAWTRFLYSTRKSFLGSKSSDGIFRRRAQQIRRGQGATGIFGGRTGNWPKNMVNAWKGKVTRQSWTQGANLKMGTGYKSEKPFMRGLYGMEKSTPTMTVTSSENMVFPAYRNLLKKGISIHPMHVGRKNSVLAAANGMKLFARKFGDKTILFDAEDTYKSGEKKGKTKPSAVMFILKKKFTLPKKIDFFGLWNTQQGKAVKRLNNILRQTIRGIEKGYIPV